MAFGSADFTPCVLAFFAQLLGAGKAGGGGEEEEEVKEEEEEEDMAHFRNKKAPCGDNKWKNYAFNLEVGGRREP